ncbi:molybdate ABC transporter permease subunit [Panacibacter sp. DH6]|uniref:Molybdenum transport system permease n=1 Tax=Panacibacter microcysteis TaxID=2793269 RepID=A0A931GXH4_9BACT|nr:molybdate ABC transporter permease subunit [Panacibacter microcysteis]MBG9375719.1 molybdate ABC transporter permease subunit [Panacibacter microcysteis]
MVEFEPFWLTVKLAFVTTIILLLCAIPLAWWLAYKKDNFKTIIEAVVSLPLVLPPSVIGFYLLLAFSPSNAFGKMLEQYFDVRLAFSFPGLVIASVIYSLPFMIHPVHAGFTALSQSLREASYSLGKSKWQTLWHVLLPNIKPALLSGIVLTFAHTIGEFGVVLMIGGNIPGQTKVASIAIYDEVETMNYAAANAYALILFVAAFIILLALYLINRRFDKIKFYD